MQHVNEVLAVEADLSGVPVHQIVHLQRDQGPQHIVAGGVLIQGIASPRHAGQRIVKFRIGPARRVAHHRTGADQRLNRKGRRDLVQFAVHFHGAQHRGEDIIPAQLLVRIQIGIQILQQPLGCQLAVGQPAQAQEIRHVAGQDLRGQLGQAGAVIVLRVVLGVVQYPDAGGFVAAVELDDGDYYARLYRAPEDADDDADLDLDDMVVYKSEVLASDRLTITVGDSGNTVGDSAPFVLKFDSSAGRIVKAEYDGADVFGSGATTTLTLSSSGTHTILFYKNTGEHILDA